MEREISLKLIYVLNDHVRGRMSKFYSINLRNRGQSLIIINLYAKLHAIFSPICEFYCELN